MLTRARTTIAGIAAAAMLATTTVAVPMAQAGSATLSEGAPIVLAGYKGGKYKGNNCWKYGKCYGGYHRYRHNDNDFAIGVFGFAAGALIGSMLAQPRYYHSGYSNADAYCSAKYRSYKPWTGTYTTFKGYEKACP